MILQVTEVVKWTSGHFFKSYLGSYEAIGTALPDRSTQITLSFETFY